MEERTRVVILGGGFGGLVVARELARSDMADGFDITVVDANPMHVYAPWLYELATSCLTSASDAEEWSEAKHALDISFSSLEGFDGVRFRRGVVKNIDKASRHVTFEDGMTAPYDMLVVALGAETNYFGIEGLREHSVSLKTLADAYENRRRIVRRLREHSHNTRPFHVVVGGAGPNGIELATELMATANASEENGILPRHGLDVTLIDGASDVLMNLAPSLRKRARRHLERLGIRTRLSVVLSAAASDHVVITPTPAKSQAADAPKPVEQLSCDLCVWAGGITMGKAVRDMSFPKDPKGRILVGDTFLVQGEDRVFAVGDCASSNNPFTQNAEPQTAQVAVRQAFIAAENIQRIVAHVELMEVEHPKRWPILITLGGKYALGTFAGLTVWGYPAYVLRRLVDLHYFLTILPLASALRFWWRGVEAYAKNEEGE